MQIKTRLVVFVTVLALLVSLATLFAGCEMSPTQEPTQETVDPQTALRQAMKGKVISILSASTSTFAGYIPEADGFNLKHRARYPQDNLLTNVYQTWWMRLIVDWEAQLGINDSWAGSQVFNDMDKNSGDLGRDAAMASLTRIQNLASNGTPDVIFFYGGGNDVGRLVPLGSFDPATAPAEVDLTSYKWETFAEAYTTAVMRLQHYYPDALIVIMLPPFVKSYYTPDELARYSKVMIAIADHYGVPYIDLRDSKATLADLPDGTHPNAKGMECMANLIEEKMLEFCDLETGEHTVYTIRHQLANAKGTKRHIKGVDAGASFHEIITGKNKNIKVTIDGVDVTDTCYKDGVIYIEKVTGHVVISNS